MPMKTVLRQTPFIQSKRSSFIFGKAEPWSVSTKGRPTIGPYSRSNFVWAAIDSRKPSGMALKSSTNSSQNRTDQGMSNHSTRSKPGSSPSICENYF